MIRQYAEFTISDSHLMVRSNLRNPALPGLSIIRASVTLVRLSPVHRSFACSTRMANYALMNESGQVRDARRGQRKIGFHLSVV